MSNSESTGAAFRWYNPTENGRIERIEIKEPDYSIEPTTITPEYQQAISKAVRDSSSTELTSLNVDSDFFKQDSTATFDTDSQLRSSHNTTFDYDLNSDFFEEEPLILENDIWNGSTISRRTPAWLIDQIEHERTEQIRAGADPILLGKWHRVQHAFMKDYLHPSTVMPLIEKADEVLTHASSNLLDSSAEIAVEVTTGISHVFENISGKVHSLVETAKDKFGVVDPTTTAGVTRLEEKERARRMHEKHDPYIEARKRRFEDELLTTVKPSC